MPGTGIARFLACVAALVAVLVAGCRAAAEGALDLTPKASEAVGAPDAAKIRLYGASKALVIGIDNYGTGWFTQSRPWPKLSMAIKDAEEVAKALTEQGFKVTLKTDLASADLDAAFRDFFLTEGADPDARLLIWFAGHGHTIEGEGYLVPADAPGVRPYDIEFRRKAISLRRFGEYMREARAKHVLAIFDSCFAGTVFNVARAAPPPAITYSTGLPVRQFVSSGEAEQQVSDDGTFRRLFVDALRGLEPGADANKDGYITGTELGQFLFDKVTNLTNKGQTPRYGKLNALGYDRGDFVLEARRLESAPAPALPPLPPPTAAQALSEAGRTWDMIKATSSTDVLDAFIKQFPGTVYAALALEKATQVRGAAAEAAKKTAEADRKAAERAESERQATAKVAALATEQAQKKTAADAARARDPIAALTPGAGKTEFARDTLADGKPCPFCPELVVVPKGAFQMGSSPAEIVALVKEFPDWAENLKWESPRHTVTLPQPFAVGRFAVTFDEWDACVDGGGCKTKPKDQGWGRGNRPVINVSWDEITQEYIPWLNTRTGKTYRLLSEAEREYVTRGGTTTAFWWGPQDSTDQANYDGNHTLAGSTKGELRAKTVPVDSFKPNPWGLYQVHGNVYDWTADCWHDSYQTKDSKAPSDGSPWIDACTDSGRRVVRGGSWGSDPQFLRSASRYGNTTDVRYNDLGFRVGRTLSP